MVKNIDESQNFTSYLNAILNIILEIVIIVAIFLLLKVNFFHSFSNFFYFIISLIFIFQLN